MTDITAEIVKKVYGEITFRRELWPDMEVTPNICNGLQNSSYDVTVTIRDPWTYGPISSKSRIYYHVPTGDDYAYLIAQALQNVHPRIQFKWCYHPEDERIVIEYDGFEKFESQKPLREVLKEKGNEIMRFTKVIVNGPATIAWVTTGRNPAKKVVIKKADWDAYDLEKAMLMCWAKSLFNDDTDFHKWFRTNMKQFQEAYDKAHPDVGMLPAVDAKAISENINATLERMSKKLREYKEKINSAYGKAAVGDNIVKVEKKGEPWTWDEISFLNRHYNSKSTKSIAMALGRSEYAVRSKAKRLGIKKRGNTNE